MGKMRGLRFKLIMTFLFVGLLPLLAAMGVATKTVSEMQEREMVAKLNQAVVQAQKYMEREGNRLAMVAYMTLKDGRLRKGDLASSRKVALEIRKSHNVDFVCLYHGSRSWGDPDIGLSTAGMNFPGGYGVTTVVYRGERLPALVGVYRDGGWTGVAGKLISVSYIEDLEEITGVEVAVCLKDGREWGVPDDLLPQEERELKGWLARVLTKGIPLYDDHLRMGGRDYKALFLPLKDWRGVPQGMFILSITPARTFESLFLENRYFALIMGLGILLSVILGWWVAGRIAEPVQRFALSAEGIAQGDYSREVPLTGRRDEIGDLARAFERMRQGLKEAQRREKLASLGELSAGLAHEIRNPLGIIKNAAEGLVARERSREEQALLLDIIIQETRRLNKLVTDFLDFARPRSPEKAVASLRDLVEEVVFSLEGEARSKGIKLVTKLEDVALPMDRHQMRQVLLNLLLNALEATPEGGEVMVSLAREGEWAVLEVADTGRGISKEHLDKIFDPFFTTKERGTGLGLALVYRMVEAHGGTIQVESGEGGSRFTVRLPGVPPKS